MWKTDKNKGELPSGANVRELPGSQTGRAAHVLRPAVIYEPHLHCMSSACLSELIDPTRITRLCAHYALD